MQSASLPMESNRVFFWLPCFLWLSWERWCWWRRRVAGSLFWSEDDLYRTGHLWGGPCLAGNTYPLVLSSATLWDSCMCPILEHYVQKKNFYIGPSVSYLSKHSSHHLQFYDLGWAKGSFLQFKCYQDLRLDWSTRKWKRNWEPITALSLTAVLTECIALKLNHGSLCWKSYTSQVASSTLLTSKGGPTWAKINWKFFIIVW